MMKKNKEVSEYSINHYFFNIIPCLLYKSLSTYISNLLYNKKKIKNYTFKNSSIYYLDSGITFENCNFNNIDFQTSFFSIDFINCKFNNCKFKDNIYFDKCSFTEVLFSHITCENKIMFSICNFYDFKFNDSKITELNISESYIKSFSIEKLSINSVFDMYANTYTQLFYITDTYIRKINMDKCTSTYLLMSNFNKNIFDNIEIRKTNFNITLLKSEIHNIFIYQSSLILSLLNNDIFSYKPFFAIDSKIDINNLQGNKLNCLLSYNTGFNFNDSITFKSVKSSNNFINYSLEDFIGISTYRYIEGFIYNKNDETIPILIPSGIKKTIVDNFKKIECDYAYSTDLKTKYVNDKNKKLIAYLY